MHCRSSSQRSPSQQLSVKTSAENMQISSFNQRGEVYIFLVKDSHPLINFSDDLREFQIYKTCSLKSLIYLYELLLICKQSALALSHMQKKLERSNMVSCLPLSLDFKVHPRESLWQSELRNCAGESWRTLPTGTKTPIRRMRFWLSVWSRWLIIGQVLCGIETKYRWGAFGTDPLRVR